MDVATARHPLVSMFYVHLHPIVYIYNSLISFLMFQQYIQPANSPTVFGESVDSAHSQARLQITVPAHLSLHHSLFKCRDATLPLTSLTSRVREHQVHSSPQYKSAGLLIFHYLPEFRCTKYTLPKTRMPVPRVRVHRVSFLTKHQRSVPL